MTAAEFAGYLAGYAGSFDAPVEEHSGVRSLRRSDGGFTVDTDRGSGGGQRRDRHRLVRQAPTA